MGTSKTTMTIDARLTPAKGGAPLLFQVAGNRTNLSEIVNLLAGKISELLKAGQTVKEWNAADEAARFFDEAEWALRWGAWSEAQMASDSAWVLGKQDLDCAALRMKSYLPEVTSGLYNFETGSFLVNEGLNAAEVMRAAENDMRRNQAGVVVNVNGGTLNYSILEKTPRPEAVDRAVKVMTLYEDLSHVLAERVQMTNDIATPVGGAWFKLGIADLTAAAKYFSNSSLSPVPSNRLRKSLLSCAPGHERLIAGFPTSPLPENITMWETNSPMIFP